MKQKKSLKLKVSKSNRFVYVRPLSGLITDSDPTVVITTTLTAFAN